MQAIVLRWWLLQRWWRFCSVLQAALAGHTWATVSAAILHKKVIHWSRISTPSSQPYSCRLLSGTVLDKRVLPQKEVRRNFACSFRKSSQLNYFLLTSKSVVCMYYSKIFMTLARRKFSNDVRGLQFTNAVQARACGCFQEVKPTNTFFNMKAPLGRMNDLKAKDHRLIGQVALYLR